MRPKLSRSTARVAQCPCQECVVCRTPYTAAEHVLYKHILSKSKPPKEENPGPSLNRGFRASALEPAICTQEA